MSETKKESSVSQMRTGPGLSGPWTSGLQFQFASQLLQNIIHTEILTYCF